jgi:hypothetical protein
LNAQLKCERIPFQPGIIELTLEIGVHGTGKKTHQFGAGALMRLMKRTISRQNRPSNFF